MSGRTKLAIALEATAGGTRKHVRELALGLDPSTFDVHVILSFHRSREMRADVPVLRARGVHVHEIEIPRQVRPLEDSRALCKLVGLFARERFDVLHTQSSTAGFLGRLAARRAGVPRVFHTPHVWPFQWTRPPLSRIYFHLERLAATLCDKIVCVGREQFAIGVASGVASAQKMIVIPNGVDVPAADGGRRRAEVRSSLGLTGDEVAVGMVARLSPQKGVGKFIEAAALVARECPEARFFLIGSGPLESAMRCRARTLSLGPGRFGFMGHCERAETLYPGFDVFCLSSLYEGLPYVILEAMAAGLPVVATRVTGTEELVDDGVSGRLVPLGDAHAIARGIADLVCDAAKRRSFGTEGLKRVRERFGTGRFVEAHARLYRKEPS